MVTSIINRFFGINFIFIMLNCIAIAQPTCPAVSPTSNCDPVGANSVYLMQQSTTLDFTFDSFGKYLSGITFFSAVNLRLIVTDNNAVLGHPAAAAGADLYACHWKLRTFIDNSSYNAGYAAPAANEWGPQTLYGGAVMGPYPPTNLLEIRARNECNTQDVVAFSSLASTAATLNVINHVSSEQNKGACDGTHVNVPGSYLTDKYGEYHFLIDFRVKPTLDLKPGVYTLVVRYCLSEDL